MRLNLVLIGGGTRLPAFVGAIAALRDLGAEIVRVGGVSGGSVVGAFVAAGFCAARTQELAVGTDYRQFMNASLPAMLAGNGICSGRRFERWLDSHLAGARFGDLGIDFRVVAADILNHRPVIFSPSTTPDIRVAEGVRYSMGIPGYFACRPWRGHLLVDGGLTPAAPWSLFDDTADARTIYVLLAGTGLPAASVRRRFLWPWEYAFRLVQTMMLALENVRVPADRWPQTALIRTGTTDGFDFAMTPAQKSALVEEGYSQTKTHLLAKGNLFAPSD